MLVITRTLGESFRIGDDVIVKVTQVNGIATKLGVNAPKNISVHRKEIYERIGADNLEKSAIYEPLDLTLIVN